MSGEVCDPLQVGHMTGSSAAVTNLVVYVSALFSEAIRWPILLLVFPLTADTSRHFTVPPVSLLTVQKRNVLQIRNQ